MGQGEGQGPIPVTSHPQHKVLHRTENYRQMGFPSAARTIDFGTTPRHIQDLDDHMVDDDDASLDHLHHPDPYPQDLETETAAVEGVPEPVPVREKRDRKAKKESGDGDKKSHTKRGANSFQVFMRHHAKRLAAEAKGMQVNRFTHVSNAWAELEDKGPYQAEAREERAAIAAAASAPQLEVEAVLQERDQGKRGAEEGDQGKRRASKTDTASVTGHNQEQGEQPAEDGGGEKEEEGQVVPSVEKEELGAYHGPVGDGDESFSSSSVSSSSSTSSSSNSDGEELEG